MTSTRANPRIAQSGVALTSLGAVGGARGTAAGALRIFVEFLTTYDKKGVQQLEGDLATIDKQAAVAATQDAKRLQKLASVRNKIAETDNLFRNRVDAATRKQIKLVEGLAGVRTKAGKAQRAIETANLQTLLKAQGLTAREAGLLSNRLGTRKEEAKFVGLIDKAEERAVERSKRRASTESTIGKIQATRAALAPRLAGLAIGAIGGIVGGAVLGVGFALAEQGIAKIGDALQDLIDPARHARENVEGLAKAVSELAANENIRTFEAAQKLVSGFGIDPTSTQGTQLTNLLTEVTVRQQILDNLKQEAQLLDLLKNKKQIDKEANKQIATTLIEEAKAAGTYREELQRVYDPYTLTKQRTVTQGYIGDLTVEEATKQRLAAMTGQLTDQQYNLAQATAAAAQAASDASALWDIYAQSLAAAINTATGIATAGIDAKIDRVRDSGPSKRTQRLQAAVDRGAGAGGGDGGAKARELANIAEEKALLLLKMRLRLLGTNINLEKYSGKFLLVAIDAKIAALQKEGDAQQRVNQLLSIQYRLSQESQRQQGESIQSFLERRANEQRELLQERDDLERQSQIESLENKKQQVEDEVALAELAERKQAALRAQGTSNHASNLAKQLAASKAADEKARKARIKALQEQKKQREKDAADAIALASESSYQQTLAGIRAMKTLEDINKFAGRLNGLVRARATIQGLVEGFGLPKEVAAPLLARLNSLIASATQKSRDVAAGVRERGGDTGRGYAKGGVFELTNASTMFGNNIRTGEEGTELGVVLSHRVADILQRQKGSGPQQVGPFYIQKSDDPYRDAYRMRKAVEGGLESALG